jgi:hypothetical protein
MKIIVWIHTLYTQKWEFDYKPIWYLLEKYFPNKYIVLRHCINGWEKSRIYVKWIKKSFKSIYIIPSRITVLRYLFEFIYNFFYLIYAKIKYRNITYFAIDPLNASAWSFLKKIWIIDNFIFITPDFADTRFENKFLNYFYFFCDKISTKNCDYNYCVSTEIIKRKNIIYKNISNKLKHLPCYPPNKINSSWTKKQFSLIFIWHLYSQIDFIGLFSEIKKLKIEFPNIILNIVWDWEDLWNYKKYITENNLLNNIKFLWYLEHKKALNLIQESEIWIAIYKGDLFFDKYRDSCKVREYLSLNCIPIITNTVPSICNEIKRFGAWEVIEADNINNLWKRIRKIFSHKEEYYGNIKKLNNMHKNTHTDLINNLKIWKE